VTPRKATGLIASTIALAAIGGTFLTTRDVRHQTSPSKAAISRSPVSADTAASARVQPSGDAHPGAIHVKEATASRTMIGWQRGLYDPQTTAAAFAEAIPAAESGDLTALREIRDLLVRCRPVLEFVREGGSRELYLSNQLVPVNGVRWHEPFFDRCAAIATAFAKWPLTEGRLTATYWETLGAKFDDPLLRSFAIAEDVEGYANAETDKRPGLRARMADNLHRVLRSADAAAWADLGFRLRDPRLTSNNAVGIALIRIACDRGYDCTKDNVHNLGLQCDGNADPNCGAATTLQEAFEQRERPETMADAQSLYERLTLLLDQRDWDEIERLIRLDGTAFNPETDRSS